MMDIVIEEPLNKFANKIYQGQRWRYPSMTDVKFINDEYIVAAHRYGCKVYVIRLHNGTFTIVETLTMTHKNKPYQTESFVIVDSKLYMLSFANIMTIIDILPNYTLQQKKTIVLDDARVPFHGIALRDNTLYITPSRKTIGTEYILSYNILNGEIRNIATLGDDLRVKHLMFLDNDLIVAVVNYKTDTSMAEQGHAFNGSIRLYDIEFKLLDNIEVPLTHFDGIACKGNVFYATGADLIGGYIYKGVVHDGKIKSLCKHQVNDFPHGIDIRNNLIAYTSYSTSGIHIIDDNLVNSILIL
jgi:hypothetical protein